MCKSPAPLGDVVIAVNPYDPLKTVCKRIAATEGEVILLTKDPSKKSGKFAIIDLEWGLSYFNVKHNLRAKERMTEQPCRLFARMHHLMMHSNKRQINLT